MVQYVMLGEKDKPNDLKTYNLNDGYNIMTLQTKFNDTREMVIFKSAEEDQKKALEMVSGLLDDLRNEKRMVDNDSEIVNIDTYKEIPSELLGEKGTTKTFTPGKSTTYNTGNCGWQNDDWKKKQEERKKREAEEEKMRWTPTSIKRGGENPGLKDLNLLKKKIAAIAAGEYKYNLPDVKGEEDEDDLPGATATGEGEFIAG
jgi:hypothetical protein